MNSCAPVSLYPAFCLVWTDLCVCVCIVFSRAPRAQVCERVDEFILWADVCRKGWGAAVCKDKASNQINKLQSGSGRFVLSSLLNAIFLFFSFTQYMWWQPEVKFLKWQICWCECLSLKLKIYRVWTGRYVILYSNILFFVPAETCPWHKIENCQVLELWHRKSFVIVVCLGNWSDSYWFT